MRKVIRGSFVAGMMAIGMSALLSAAATAPVADAAMNGDKAAVRTLLKSAADVNAAQGDGMTALHWAAMSGDLELAQMLVFAGANVRATTRLGAYTSLFLASQQGHATVIDALIKAGSDVKAGTPNGTSPLMVAAAAGKADAVKVLVDAGADVNAKDGVRAQTPIMYAAAANRADVITLLASKGADLKATSKVSDLASLSRESLGFGGNPQAPGAPPRSGAAPAGGRVPMPGVDRNYQLNELINATFTRRRTGDASAVGASRGPRPDRHQVRLRHFRLRQLHGPPGWPASALVRAAHVRRRRQECDDD